MQENSGLYREKSMERISSPEKLNDYMCVTTPSVWLVLAAVLYKPLKRYILAEDIGRS